MRLAAQAKMGYYPTPEPVTQLISDMLVRGSKGIIRIFDPCAGEGIALKYIGDILEAETYGIELDTDRGTIAKDNLSQCLITDYQATRISNQAFSLLYLNPPYDWAIKDNSLAETERYERTFLRNTIKYLMPNGILVYLIPQSRLDVNIAKILSYRFGNIRVFRFPEDEYKVFKQIVVFGVLKKKGRVDDQMYEYLVNIGKERAIIPYMNKINDQYDVHVSPVIKQFIFRSNQIDPDELESEIEQHGMKSDILKITSPVTLMEKIKPLMPLRQGHLVQLLACGMMNGIVFDRSGNNPLLVKGITKKIADTKIEYEDDKEKIIETDKIIIIINAITQYGHLFEIQ